MYLNTVVYLPVNPVPVESESSSPQSFMLYQNYPNPFNPITTIRYEIHEQSVVTLKVFNVLGNEITTLVSKEQPVGSYELEFDAKELNSGIYFYRLQTSTYNKTRKMMLLK